MEIYDVHKALKILQQYYITDSIQMVTRWIREGKIKAERSANRKEGWHIHHEDLFEFIEEQRPGLAEVMAIHEWYVNHSFHTITHDQSKGVAANQSSLITLEESECLESELVKLQAELKTSREAIEALADEVKKLRSDYNFVIELYEQTDELYQEQKKLNEETLNKESLKTYERKLDKPMSINEFESIFNTVLKEQGTQLSSLEEDKNELIKSMYVLYFQEDEQLKGEIIRDEEYYCPLTTKSYKNLKSMLKNAIRNKIEQVNNPNNKEMMASD